MKKNLLLLVVLGCVVNTGLQAMQEYSSNAPGHVMPSNNMSILAKTKSEQSTQSSEKISEPTEVPKLIPSIPNTVRDFCKLTGSIFSYMVIMVVLDDLLSKYTDAHGNTAFLLV